jgi:hypothetical protein
MSILQVGLRYFRTGRDVLQRHRYRARLPLLARLRQDRADSMKRTTDDNTNDAGMILLPCAYDFESLSTLGSIKCLIALHALRPRGGRYSFDRLSTHKLAHVAQLSRRLVAPAITELVDRNLISYTPRLKAGALVDLLDPEGSGVTIDDMFDTDTAERDAAYAAHDEGYWYRELVGANIMLDPSAFEYGRRAGFKSSVGCPFCGHGDEKTRDHRLTVEVKKFEDGHRAEWLCHKCGAHGNCRKLFDRLWLRRKLQRQREAALPKTQFPMKKVELSPDDEFPF